MKWYKLPWGDGWGDVWVVPAHVTSVEIQEHGGASKFSVTVVTVNEIYDGPFIDDRAQAEATARQIRQTLADMTQS